MTRQRRHIPKMRGYGRWTVVLVLALASMAGAASYVSLNGGFYVDYPNSWRQVDYETVDFFLSQAGANPEAYNYEAVLAASDSGAFYEQEYVILRIDTVGELTRRQMDSTAADLADVYDEQIAFASLGETLDDLRAGRPVLDRDKRLFVRLSELEGTDGGQQRDLYMVKFYERGLAHFYCFAPDSTFEQVRSDFYNIARSLSTEDIASRLPKERVRLADPERVTKSPDENKWPLGGWLAAIGVVIVVIVLVLTRLQQKKKKKKDVV
ncbi:hypothetical protein GF420_09905 [candidate division GN15 bacterium]|nr:hypothetical protein [candidate division GN15 bacterium]